MRPFVFLLPLLPACVLSVDEVTTIDGDIQTIVVDVSKGDVDISARRGSVTLDVDFGGIGSGDVGHSVTDGVLTLDYDCGGAELCGGDVVVTAPAGVHLDLSLGGGDLTVSDMNGDVVAALGAGSVDLSGHGAADVRIDTAAGEIDARFDARPIDVDLAVALGSIQLAVPEGSYAVDTAGTSGSVDVDDVDRDDASDVRLRAVAAAGSVSIRGR